MPMLVTDHFVMLNLPKTGSTFARTVIKEIYEDRLNKRSLVTRALQRLHMAKRPICEDIMQPNIKLGGLNAEPDQHGTYTQIPGEYRGLPVISIVRNPYSRFMSSYEFRWWGAHPPLKKDLVNKHFPHFPNLSVDDFVRLSELDIIHNRLGEKKLNAEVGIQTIQFIQMFFKDPDHVLQNLTDEYLDSSDALNDMADINFLRQEKLNQDLADFLAKIGYSDEEVVYVRSRDRVNVTPKQAPDRNALWTPTALDYVRRKERMIFRILETKGIVYKEPRL
jgi:hypothetical protein